MRRHRRVHRRLGLVYPLLVTAIAQVACGDKANGWLIERRRRGRRRRADRAAVHLSAVLPPAARRQRATATTARPARGSNLGPTNPDFLDRGRAAGRRVPGGERPRAGAPVPVDAVTASASGLDPHISVANAGCRRRGSPRRAGIDVADVLALVDRAHRRPCAGRPRRAGGRTCSMLNLALDDSSVRRRRRSDWQTRIMERGTLRIYLGAAPGVGKTFAMLERGCRRRQRGTDVVVGSSRRTAERSRPRSSATSRCVPAARRSSTAARR